MKRLNVSLTTKGSLEKAIKYLEQYKEKLPNKMDIFVERLVMLGVPVIDERINAASGDSDKSHYTHVRIRSFGDYVEAILTVEGKDIMFIEFGAGVHYNGSVGTSPRKSERGTENGVEYNFIGGEDLGYTIGSYGRGQGAKDFWFYVNDKGDKVKSYGTQATMPLHEASMEIIRNVYKVAKEVFVNG